LGVQRRVYFIDGTGQINMEWIPASGNTNKFKIIYRGNFPMDGTYQLLVQGQDISGNISGDLDYRIDFEVINETTISYLMNYPNPFSTSTRFVFTLTGERIPDHMTIQIMTVSGKVVREITLAELGPINIGRNVTEYAWDGRDEFGDLLANGVYLYRVMTSLDGEKIKHRETGADEFFKQEFGKMYLMR
jgi:flagellar hook assembly protein FlgD